MPYEKRWGMQLSVRSIYLVVASLLVTGLIPFGDALQAQRMPDSGTAMADSQSSFSRLSRVPPRRIAALYEEVTRSATDFVVAARASMYARPSDTNPIANLQEGDLVRHVRRDGEWSVVRTKDGRIGYVSNAALSNTWILVVKQKQRVYVYRHHKLLASFDADLAVNPAGDKEQRGGFSNPDQRRTPEGLFFISKLNPDSKFHKALVINYPTPTHAERGFRSGLISRKEYAEIVEASMMFDNPPMYTRLGGWIEFHGSGVQGAANWTDGCIALSDSDMDRLYEMAKVGTPVMIVP